MRRNHISMKQANLAIDTQIEHLKLKVGESAEAIVKNRHGRFETVVFTRTK